MSAFVLPAGMPVADDDRQLPMFPGQDARTELLIHLLEDAVQTVHTLVEMNQLLTQKALERPQRTAPVQPTGPRRPHQPQNKELREWHSFRAYFVGLERSVRRDRKLRPDDEVGKEMLYAAGGPPPKTMTRHQEYHGLQPDQWPPSTWPEEPPASPEDKK